MEKYSDFDITLRPLEISNGDDTVKWYMDEKVRLVSNAVDVENAASQCVMEKGGFVREGVLENSDPGTGYSSIQ